VATKTIPKSAATDDVVGAAQRAAADRNRTGAGPDIMPMLKAGMAEIDELQQLKHFPEYFVRFAEQTGLRLLLLKRWTSGLQVFLETNIRMPKEARQKRTDGRAPIPSLKGDIFETTGDEGAVYCGPVPLKHFPLDMTIMLGRGSRDRRIIVMPVPSQKHWNTFIYLDSGDTSGRALAVAEVLARYALARMVNLRNGGIPVQGKVSSILKAERNRRQQAQTNRGHGSSGDEAAPGGEAESTPANCSTAADHEAPDPVAGTELASHKSAKEVPEVDPFAAPPPTSEDGKAPAPRGRAKDGSAECADDLPDIPAWDALAEAGTLTPEMILNHSGELPALPKAAAHIMAVIEDPRTTATGLEKALAMDQALTAKVLRIANSPFYGAVREIRTVSEAIVRLGFVAIRNWTLVTAARSVFLAPGAGMLYRRIWKQSVLSAMASQLVAQVARGIEPESVFIGGLMQNIGQLVLARSHPEMFQEILTESAEKGEAYHEIERNMLGFDHGALGALLIREWNLSAELEAAVRWHHRLDHEDATNCRMAAMIALGEEVARCSGADNSDEDGERPEPRASEAAAYLNITPAQLDDLRRQAEDLHIDPHFFS